MPRSRYMPVVNDRRIRSSRKRASKGRTVGEPTSDEVSADWSDQNLIMLLTDPGVRILMHADRVDECELMATRSTVSVQRSGGCGHPKPTDVRESAEPHLDYRPGVGMAAE
jgi:hypothetical protein